MKFRIDKRSKTSAHEQLREQIIMQISTGELGIGREMPAVRALARQLGLSVNTVSKVYSELAQARWLLERAGAHHKVIARTDAPAELQLETIDDLIERMAALAAARGYSLQDLARRLRTRLLEKPADHLLILEPEPELGLIMREEIRQKIGYAPPVCNLDQVERDATLRIGATIITPAYLIGRLRHLGADVRRVLAVQFSPLDPLIERIAKLSQPSLIGWVSVSAAGLKTISGIAAPAAEDRHSNQFFLLEHRAGKAPPRLRPYSPEHYQPGDILNPSQTGSHPRRAAQDAEDDATRALADLAGLDLVFCDSNAAAVVSHPRCIPYQLLSKPSLKRIAEEAAKLPPPR